MTNVIDANTSTFLDLFTSNLFVPHIIDPTRFTPNSKTLIDNIFSNSPIFSEGISGNITLSISDHLAQFLLIPMNLVYVPSKMYVYKRDTKNFDRENFLLDLLDIDWSSFGKGIYIVNLKISKTIPVFKGKGSPLDYNNYRPISLLSNINLIKLIEKLMYVRLYNFLSKHNCICELQFGFLSEIQLIMPY